MHKQADQAIHDSFKGGHVVTKATAPQSTNIFRSILSSSLPADEKRRDRMAQEGFVVIAAGSETTAQILATATYHLLANQESALVRLKEELAVAMQDPDTRPEWATLQKLPWLVSYPLGAMEGV